MGKLSTLPNISTILEKELHTISIKTQQDLRAAGSKVAFSNLWQNDPSACLSKLYALEGAVQGIRWHRLSDDVKANLKAFHRALSGK